MPIFEYVPHPRIAWRQVHRPTKVADQLPTRTSIDRFNTWLAVKITNGVGTMWCAYLFTAIALVSLPAAIRSGQVIVIVSWIAQTFLQLVLLSIIMVGQNILSAASDKRAESTYLDAEAVLHEAQEIQSHLAAQDKALEELIAKVGGGPSR
ncbi:MAG TPA: hypothetical protein VE261_04215 [Gaiellaceae bacterium]|nr:hypothetical protein [Gaiellaceae bacterium]